MRQENEERVVVITLVDPANHKIVGQDPWGQRLILSLQFTDPGGVTTVPAVGDAWTVVRHGHEWFLERPATTSAGPETVPFTGLNPGDKKVEASGDLHLAANNIQIYGTDGTSATLSVSNSSFVGDVYPLPINPPDSVFPVFDAASGTWEPSSVKPANITNRDIGATAAIAKSKLALTGTIIDSDIASNASIAKTKLAPLAIVDADVASGAAIAKSKLAPLAIVDADVAAGAAIAKAKLAPLAIVDADVASGAAIAKTKLAPLAIVDADVSSTAAIAASKISGLSTFVAYGAINTTNNDLAWSGGSSPVVYASVTPTTTTGTIRSLRAPTGGVQGTRIVFRNYGAAGTKVTFLQTTAGGLGAQFNHSGSTPASLTLNRGESVEYIYEATSGFWVEVSKDVNASRTTVSALSSGPPSSPADGDVWVATGVGGAHQRWSFQYNATGDPSYKWEFMGGSTLVSAAGVTIPGTSVWTSTASTTVVRPGIYDIIVAWADVAAASGASTYLVGMMVNGTATGQLGGVSVSNASYNFTVLGVPWTSEFTSANSTLATACWANAGPTQGPSQSLSVIPIMVS